MTASSTPRVIAFKKGVIDQYDPDLHKGMLLSLMRACFEDTLAMIDREKEGMLVMKH